MNRFNFKEYAEINTRFKKHFGISFESFYEKVLSLGFQYPMIDLILFDDWLQKKFGPYQGSLSDFITLQFGEEANDLINRLI